MGGAGDPMGGAGDPMGGAGGPGSARDERDGRAAPDAMGVGRDAPGSAPGDWPPEAQRDVPRWTGPARRGWRGWLLAFLLAFVTIGAVYGGIGLIINGLGMPADWADRLPLRSWVVGGLALLLTVALPQALSCRLVLRSHPRAAVAGVLAGLALIAWIGVQLLVLRRYFFLQPVIAGIGLAELLLGWSWLRRAGPRGQHRA
jgi:hypothetical protein